MIFKKLLTNKIKSVIINISKEKRGKELWDVFYYLF